MSAYENMLKEFKVLDDEVCFIGDDVADLSVMRRCGVSVAVANAVSEVKQIADYVTVKKGGHGAVREVVELILKAQGHWGPNFMNIKICFCLVVLVLCSIVCRADETTESDFCLHHSSCRGLILTVITITDRKPGMLTAPRLIFRMPTFKLRMWMLIFMVRKTRI